MSEEKGKRRVILVTRLSDSAEWDDWKKLYGALRLGNSDPKQFYIEGNFYNLIIVKGENITKWDKNKKFLKDYKVNFNRGPCLKENPPDKDDLVLVHYGGEASHDDVLDWYKEKSEVSSEDEKQKCPLYAPLSEKKFTLSSYSTTDPGWKKLFEDIQREGQNKGEAWVADTVCAYFLGTRCRQILDNAAVTISIKNRKIDDSLEYDMEEVVSILQPGNDLQKAASRFSEHLQQGEIHEAEEIIKQLLSFMEQQGHGPFSLV